MTRRLRLVCNGEDRARLEKSRSGIELLFKKWTSQRAVGIISRKLEILKTRN